MHVQALRQPGAARLPSKVSASWHAVNSDKGLIREADENNLARHEYRDLSHPSLCALLAALASEAWAKRAGSPADPGFDGGSSRFGSAPTGVVLGHHSDHSQPGKPGSSVGGAGWLLDRVGGSASRAWSGNQA